jgi:uncharacterized protein YbaR (Trm112 family)
MTLSKDLLDILVCPETKMPVALADAQLLSALNTAVEEGLVKNRGGKPVETALEEALVREDGNFAYPIRDGIPVMLIDEGIALEQVPGRPSPQG